jgi:hypothetical protein
MTLAGRVGLDLKTRPVKRTAFALRSPNSAILPNFIGKVAKSTIFCKLFVCVNLSAAEGYKGDPFEIWPHPYTIDLIIVRAAMRRQSMFHIKERAGPHLTLYYVFRLILNYLEMGKTERA